MFNETRFSPLNSIIVRCLSKQRLLSVFHYTPCFMLFVCQNMSFHRARFGSIAALRCLDSGHEEAEERTFFFREIQNSSRHGRNNSLYQFINWLRSWENPAFRNSIQSKRTAGQNMTKARVKYDWRFINFPTDCGLRHSWFSEEKEKL